MKLSVVLKVTVGFLALLMGVIGVLIPVWPTTPFVLLAVGCFSATPKLQAWLLRIRFFREYYDSYTLGSGLKNKTTAVSLVFLWGMLIWSGILTQSSVMRFIFVIIGISVTAHIMWISRARIIRRKS